MSLFAVPMDARTCHFHRTVGYLENGCRKVRISSRMMMMMRMMTMMLMMRHCEGAAAWRDAQGMWREFTWGGAWNWTFRAERRYLDPKREHPTMSMVAHHLVHLNSHLEVYIVRHTHRAGEKKTRSVLAQTPMSLFAVPMDARTCHFHRTVGYLENGCRKIMKNPNFKSNDDGDEEEEDDDDDVDDDDGDDDETLRRGCCVKRLTRHVTRVHLGGAWNWTFREERRYLDPKREHPTMSMVAHHLVHWNSHLEVYIVRHTHRAGEKKHDQC